MQIAGDHQQYNCSAHLRPAQLGGGTDTISNTYIYTPRYTASHHTEHTNTPRLVEPSDTTNCPPFVEHDSAETPHLHQSSVRRVIEPDAAKLLGCLHAKRPHLL